MKTQPATGETYPKSDLFNKADPITHLPDNADRSVAKQKFKITNWPT
ncbi:hypothetical protein, partial [Klebsiella pneumoniae]